MKQWINLTESNQFNFDLDYFLGAIMYLKIDRQKEAEREREIQIEIDRWIDRQRERERKERRRERKIQTWMRERN